MNSCRWRENDYSPQDYVSRKVARPEKQDRGQICAKVTERRRELEAQLSKLSGFGGRGEKATKFGRGGARGAVAPKYRNPDNPAETWAGRGLRPRWLTAAIKGGKNLEDFAIVGAGAKAANPGRKPRKAKRTAKK